MKRLILAFCFLLAMSACPVDVCANKAAKGIGKAAGKAVDGRVPTVVAAKAAQKAGQSIRRNNEPGYSHPAEMNGVMVSRFLPIDDDFFSYLLRTGEKITKVADLPGSAEFIIPVGNGLRCHGDLGVIHKQLSLFCVPLWNWDTYQYVIFSKMDKGYYYIPLSSSDIQYIQQYTSVPSDPELPFWDTIGGKLFALLIVGVVVYYKTRNSPQA